MGWFCSWKRLFRPSRSRFAYLLLAAVAFAVTESGRFIARPYVRRHGINDFGLTDCIGNLGGILVMIFLGCASYNANAKQSYRLAAFFSVGFVVYEFLQPILPKGTFDWLDVYGTAIGYSLSLLVITVLWRVVPDPEDTQGTRSDGVE